MDLIHAIRAIVMPSLFLLTTAFVTLGLLVSPRYHLGTAVFGALLVLGVFDLMQSKHSITKTDLRKAWEGARSDRFGAVA